MLQYLAIKNTAVYCKNCRVLWNAICTAVEVLLLKILGMLQARHFNL